MKDVISKLLEKIVFWDISVWYIEIFEIDIIDEVDADKDHKKMLKLTTMTMIKLMMTLIMKLMRILMMKLMTLMVKMLIKSSTFVTFVIVKFHQRKFLTDTFKQHLNAKHLNVINVIIRLLKSLLLKFIANHNMKMWSLHVKVWNAIWK